MSEQWIGFSLSVKSKDFTTSKNHSYQGVVTALSDHDLTLCRVFKDGLPYKEKTLTLRLEDINEMDVIDKPHNDTSDVWLYDQVPSISTDVASGSQSNLPSGAIPNPYAFLNIQSETIRNSTDTESTETPKATNVYKKSRKQKKGRDDTKNKICFGGDLQEIKSQDFDFEKNLALFDKKTVFEEIDKNKKRNKRDKELEKQVTIKEMSLLSIDDSLTSVQKCGAIYQTDNGLNLVSIPKETHDKLLEVAIIHGISIERHIELMSRGTTDLSLQLLSLTYRSYCDVSHQSANVVFMCGTNTTGAIGVCTARHLESHGVNTVIFIKERASINEILSKELSLYALTEQGIKNRIRDLPVKGVDLVIIALENDHEQELPTDAVDWIENVRAAIICINPPPTGYNFTVKMSIIPAWPIAHPDRNGKIYLCNTGIPSQIYKEVGIDYKCPFGAKLISPLYKLS